MTALELGVVVVEPLDDAQPTAAAMHTSTAAAAAAASEPAGLPAPGFPVLGFPASDFTAVSSLWSAPRAFSNYDDIQPRRLTPR